MPDKIDQLYEALRKDGAVTKSRDNFRNYVLAPGDEGVQNRKALYEALKADGAVTSPTQDEFERRLEISSATSSPSAQTAPGNAPNAVKQQDAAAQTGESGGLRWARVSSYGPVAIGGAIGALAGGGNNAFGGGTSGGGGAEYQWSYTPPQPDAGQVIQVQPQKPTTEQQDNTTPTTQPTTTTIQNTDDEEAKAFSEFVNAANKGGRDLARGVDENGNKYTKEIKGVYTNYYYDEGSVAQYLTYSDGVTRLKRFKYANGDVDVYDENGNATRIEAPHVPKIGDPGGVVYLHHKNPYLDDDKELSKLFTKYKNNEQFGDFSKEYKDKYSKLSESQLLAELDNIKALKSRAASEEEKAKLAYRQNHAILELNARRSGFSSYKEAKSNPGMFAFRRLGTWLAENYPSKYSDAMLDENIYYQGPADNPRVVFEDRAKQAVLELGQDTVDGTIKQGAYYTNYLLGDKEKLADFLNLCMMKARWTNQDPDKIIQQEYDKMASEVGAASERLVDAAVDKMIEQTPKWKLATYNMLGNTVFGQLGIWMGKKVGTWTDQSERAFDLASAKYYKDLGGWGKFGIGVGHLVGSLPEYLIASSGVGGAFEGTALAATTGGRILMSTLTMEGVGLMNMGAHDLNAGEFSGWGQWGSTAVSSAATGAVFGVAGEGARMVSLRPTSQAAVLFNKGVEYSFETAAFTVPEWVSTIYNGVTPEGDPVSGEYFVSSALNNLGVVIAMKGRRNFKNWKPVVKTSDLAQLKVAYPELYDNLTHNLDMATRGKPVDELSEAAKTQLTQLQDDMMTPGKGVSWNTYKKTMNLFGFEVIPPAPSAVRENGRVVQVLDPYGTVISEKKCANSGEAKKEASKLQSQIEHSQERRNAENYTQARMEKLYYDTCADIADRMSDNKEWRKRGEDGNFLVDENGNYIADENYQCVTPEEVDAALNEAYKTPEAERTADQAQLVAIFEADARKMGDSIPDVKTLAEIVCSTYGITVEQLENVSRLAPSERRDNKATQAMQLFNEMLTRGVATSSRPVGRVKLKHAETGDAFIEVYNEANPANKDGYYFYKDATGQTRWLPANEVESYEPIMNESEQRYKVSNDNTQSKIKSAYDGYVATASMYNDEALAQRINWLLDKYDLKVDDDGNILRKKDAKRGDYTIDENGMASDEADLLKLRAFMKVQADRAAAKQGEENMRNLKTERERAEAVAAWGQENGVTYDVDYLVEHPLELDGLVKKMELGDVAELSSGQGAVTEDNIVTSPGDMNASDAAQYKTAPIDETVTIEGSNNLPEPKTDKTESIEAGGRYNVVDEQGAQHEVEVLRDNGNGTVEVRVDGAEDSIPMAKDQLAAMLGIDVALTTPQTEQPATTTKLEQPAPVATNEMKDADVDAGEAGLSLREKAGAYVDAYFPDVKGDEREGFIEQLVAQNDFENTIRFDKEDGVNLDRVAKYEQRLAELEKERAATNSKEASDDSGEAVEPYRIDEAADPDAIAEAGFSEDNLAATVDYLNGKIDKRKYLERLGFDKDVLAGIDDDKVNTWVEGVANRASEFLTDKPVESGDVRVESDEVPADAGTTLTPTPQPEAADATEVEATTEPMPLLDDGNPNYAGTTPERGRQYIYDESGLDKGEADAYVSANLASAEKDLDKIKNKPPKMGTNLVKYQKDKADWESRMQEAQSNVDYWNKVRASQADYEAEQAKARKAADAKVRAQAVVDEQARQAAELAKQQEQAERGAGAVHPAIAEKWNNAPKIEGYKDEVVLANGERVPGTYYLVESGAVTPSHNASREFEKYEGFPVDENGNTINDRDYERDKDAQNITRSIADKYDSRALQTPVIVSKDGVVLSGNGRTMAGELAARNNTDKAYIDHLKKYGKQFGFSPEQVSSMKHPRVVFVPDADMPYTTDTFAKFNEQEMKGQSKTEQAVKLGKVVDDATFNQIVRSINDHETLGDFYNDARAATEAINALRRAGALNEMQYAEMFDGDAVSGTGRQIIENMLIGKAFEGNPDVIRQLTEIKSLRQSVVTALNEITTNKALGKEYSLEKELAQAVDLAYKARKAGYKENEPVSPYATQLNLFPFEDGETVADYNNVAVLELADLMNDKRPTQLKKKLQDYNQQSAESAAGQMDIFSGGVKEKKEIIKTVLNTLHNGETEEASRPEQRGSVADERGGEASLQENGAADTGSAALATPQAEQSIDAAIVEASKATNTEPTDAQKEAGNYKKGHVKIDGFDVSIEQPKGSVRSGVDATGKAWSQKMNNTYGYIRGTEGVDGDHIDVFFSDNLDDWNGMVYVVDQVEKGGIFDEHKVMYGFNSEEDARKAYLSNYEDGWDGLGAITAVSKDEFKKWIDSSHRKTKPFAEYKNVKVGETQEQEPKQQGTLFPATEQQPSSKSETKPRTTEKQPAEAPKERIDDVGEKIEGAKKDLAKKMGERINLDADTFPKMFPKYDLKKLISQGLDPNLAVMTKMLRQMAQADYKHYSKKRMYGKSYALRAARFYAAYAKQVLEAGDSNVGFKSEGLGFTDYGKQFVKLNKRLFEELYNKLGDDLFDLDLAGVKIQPLSQKEGSTWFRRNQETGEMEPYNPAYAFVGPRGQNYYEANELDKALQEGVEQVSKSVDYKKTHPYKLGHYYKPGIKNSDYVGVKLGGKIVPLTEPMTSSEVRKYMSEHNAELQAKAAQLDEQRKLDKKKGGTGEGRWKPELTLGGGRPRVGVDRRGGVDVEPEEFRKAFSFRGVQFGNYVTQRERQRFLNEAYDALMDMAELLGISPRAIAIDGRLGFAIGARGGGKANAHYEPKENVINLTKSKGAGSLAHEWFHALDYYFNRGNKKPTASTANKSTEQFPASTRNEMRKAFLDLMSAIKNSDYFKRSENLEMKLRSGKLDEGYYDKPTELAARAFQDYVVRKLADKGKINDFLSSFTSEEEWNGEPENYPFPIGAEAEKIDEKFDALFDAMQERTDEEGNTILYHLGKEHDVLTDTEIALRDGLVDILRSVGLADEPDEVKGQKELDSAIQANATLQEMRGWHGSAAEFDEFDHSHMSEGEGNQAIGYGTYIASIEEIGRYYGTVAAMQKRFRAAPGYGDYDHYWKGQKIDLSSINPLRMAYDIVQREGTIKKAIAMVEKFVDNSEAHEGWRSALDILRESRKSDFKRKRANYEGERYLYEVDIPENDGTNYLPWDEPLSDTMRERIAQGLRDMGVDLNEPFERRSGKADNFDFLDEQMSEHPITGQELYYKLVDRFGRYPQQASEFLNKYCGLVGIEYPSNFFSGGNKKGLKNHVIFNERDIKIDNRTQYFISADGVVYGFVKDGKIYIDPKIATAETPIHEYCHLWGDALKEANPEAWERLKETMLGEKDVLDYVKKMYPGLEGDALVSEVFSHYSGRRGAERLRADMEREMKNAEDVFAKARVARVFDIIRRALSRFWEMARDLFAGKTRGLDKLTAEDFADMAMNDLLRGFDPRKKVSGETFYSNAERAVENIKQNKATAEQWQAMIKKDGGLKAGEDRWMGLSDWLAENKGKSLTKDEVLNFIRENGIEMEETTYIEVPQSFDSLKREYDQWLHDEGFDYAQEQLRERFGDDADIAFDDLGGELVISNEEAAAAVLGSENIINSTRLDYTTEGLDNKREIAFVTPEVEPYRESDEVHFGPENEGKAVMWVRFGETTDADGKRVLVIDEIQSNRHQDARERGYVSKGETLNLRNATNVAQENYDAFTQQMKDKYNGDYADIYANDMTDAEREHADKLEQEVYTTSDAYEQTANRIPAAPFEKNWHEVAMKRMLRLAAEEGFDKVAWTTGKQQAERYSLEGKVDRLVAYEDKNGELDARAIFPDGTYTTIGKTWDEVGRYVGKSVAQQLRNSADTENVHWGYDANMRPLNYDYKLLKADNITVGGEGMKGFYDNILPRFMDKYGKKWGVKTGTVELPNVEEAGRTMHSVDVTPAMRASVMSGQPMFQKAAPNDNFEDVPGVNKEHDEYVSIKEVEDYLATLPNAYNVHGVVEAHPINSLESLEALKPILDQELYDEIKKRIYHPNVYGCRDSKTGMVFVFTHKIWTLNHAEHNWWHENSHGAYDAIELADKEDCGREALEWLLRHGHMSQDAYNHYKDNERGTEGAARLITYIFDNYGVDGILNKNFDGNEKIAKLATAIQNYYKYGETRENKGVNLLRQGQSQAEPRTREDAINAPGRDRQGAIRPESSRRTKEEVGGTQRGTSIIDEVAEDGVGYGEADDSGISDEELAGYDAGRYSFAESITQGLVDLALKNTHDQQLRLNAMREFGGNLAKLRKIMNKQKAYDKGTVDDIVRLARMVMGSGFFKDMSAYEVKRLLAAIKKGVGAEDLTPIANNVVDMLVQHQLRESKNMLHKLMQVRGRKVDARGVEVQAGLDIDGQRMMSALKDGMSLGENGLLTRINDCENRLGSEDEVIRKNAMSEYQGLMLAKEYHDNILSGEEEEIVLRNEKRQEQEKIYDFRREPVLDDEGNAIINQDGSVRTVERKTLKPQFKNNVTDENKQLRRNTEAAIERIEQSIRESRMERVTSYIDFMSDVAGDVRASRERAAEWRAEQQQRVDEIHHNANSDLEGVPVQSQVKLPEGGLLAFNSNNDIVRLLFQPLATFEKMLRFFGRKAHNGEGYLFNRFMRGWVDCSDKEWRSKRAAHEELDAKVNELFGKKAKRWSDLYKVERNKKHPGIPVEYWDNGERVQETMSQGEALSLVVWSKQKDAEAGLRRMGISEEDIETIKNNLDPKFLQLAEWVVEEFLPKRREYYNEVHERMFGAPMAAIEHYFPIVRNSRDVEKPSDITERDLGETKPSTITGNIIKRQRTAATLDVHTDFFDHLLKHLDDMENWAAWAEFNRDINTLRNYKRFKNRVLNMHSMEYGSGKDLWKAFDDACAIAAGVYHPSTKRGSGDNLAVNIAKGVTGAKIAFRFYTAAKQLLSLPAFWNGDAGLKELAKWENPVGAIIAWNWAMKNLPGFSKRWQSRQVGDVRLMDTDSDYAFWRNNMVRALRRGGMWANALVDGMTVAMGARAVYETKKKRYLRNGYSEEQAEKRAMQDAAISYNSSQQSSEDAFLSSLQLDRTWWSTLMTVFRSASMGYQRRLTTGLRNLKNRTKKGYKAESIAFMKKQMERDGVDEATAEKAAKRTYRWGGLRSMADVFVYGFVLPFFWNLGPYALYLLMGDDDDEKKDMLKDASVHSLFGPIEGLTGGNAMSEIGNTYAGYLMSDNDKSLLNALRYHDYLSMPLGSDLQQIFNEAGNDSMAAWTDAFNLLVQAGIGINPETFTDTWAAIADACEGDPQTTKEFALCFMRVMQVPQTQTDKLFIDELGMTAKDAQKLNAMEMADRFARYKKFRNAPLLNWAYSPDESQKVAEKYRKRFLDNMQERMEHMDDEQLGWNFENPNDSERRKAAAKVYNKRNDVNIQSSSWATPGNNWKPETKRSHQRYQRYQTWEDHAEDVLLDVAIDQAKNRGDGETEKALRDAKKELTEIKRGKHTKTIDINGLGDGSADDDKAIMEELRARRKEILQEYGIIQ